MKSVLTQAVQNIEIVFVDDGSTDDLADILAAQADVLLCAIRQSNSGVSVARNRRVLEAKDELVAFLDGDDV